MIYSWHFFLIFVACQIGGCPNVEACNDLDTGDCPIEAGEEFIYNMQMKIESYFPPVSFPSFKTTFLKTILTSISYIYFRAQLTENGIWKLQMKRNLSHFWCQLEFNDSNKIHIPNF